MSAEQAARSEVTRRVSVDCLESLHSIKYIDADYCILKVLRVMPDNSDIQTQSLSLQAYSYFRRALMDGEYAPGQKIKLQEVSDELGISATPVREALLRLVSEQVLSQVDRRSVRVPIIGAERYREIRDLRLLLEGEAAEKAAQRATSSEAAQLAEIHERFIVACEEKRSRIWMVESRRFHQSVCEMARMPTLARVVENLWIETGPMMHAFVALPAPTIRKGHPHLRVIQALRKKDGALARLSIQEDITASADRVLAYLEIQKQTEPSIEGDRMKWTSPRKKRGTA
jgi:DNA-binding GntR family transcriptional regulator